MWTVGRPNIDVGQHFRRCISNVANRRLRRRLHSVTPAVVRAADVFAAHAAGRILHAFPPLATIAGTVTQHEMADVYDRRMARNGGPGRPAYDQIKSLPAFGTCPYCDHRTVSTLDHVLPKAVHPVLAVTPDNLVGCCMECNNAKGTFIPTSREDTPLHPYFDVLPCGIWLRAKVVPGAVAAVIFSARPPKNWGRQLGERVLKQFCLFRLGELYACQAAREISGHRRTLIDYYNAGGKDAVRNELFLRHRSWKESEANCWQSATYLGLGNSDWYCEEGHRLA